jgi:hypothetical protein
VDASGRLLAELASRAPQPLTVILEPDGAYPPIEHLLRQLDRAREEGRAGLSESECEALVAIDRTGLEMAATSFARKREKQRTKTGQGVGSRESVLILGHALALSRPAADHGVRGGCAARRGPLMS